MRAHFSRWVGAALLSLVALAPPAQAYTPSTLRIGFAPFDNQADVYKKAVPLVKVLTAALHMPVKPFVAGDYPGVVQALKGGKLDVAFLSPAALVLAEHVCHIHVILKSLYHNHASYYSAILTRQDTGIHTLKQLKGHSFAFVDPSSTSGSIYPKVMLLNAGLNPDKDFTHVIYAGGHDAAVLALVNHKVDAAATFANDTHGGDVPWKAILGPKASEIRVIAYSKPIPAGAIVVSDRLDPKLVTRMRDALLNLSKTPEGRHKLAEMYEVDGFVPANPADYDPVREAFTKIGLPLK
ncbi:MAG TPA: phosphate/phosphite/phosphonate ABC transporter substrate-binding protein [Oscillatoriaceae cyanobacterium]